MERLPLLYLLGLPLWAATFLGYGALVVGPFHLQWSDRLERVLLSTITGAGFFCLVVSIVGLVGWLYSPVLWLILLVGVALSLWQFRGHLKAIILPQELRRRLGEAGQQRVASQFALDKAVKAIHTLYSDLLGEGLFEGGLKPNQRHRQGLKP